MSIITLQLISFAILVALSAFFSAAEVAYTGLDRNQLKRINRLHPGALTLWEKNPNRILATLLLSNNAVNTAAGVLSVSIAHTAASNLNWNKPVLTFLSGFAAGTVLLFFGEILPKIWAQQYTVSWSIAITPFIEIWSRVVGPMARAASRVTHILLLGRARQKGGTPFLHKSELKRILAHSYIPPASQKLLDNVLDFGKLLVSDISRHPSEMFAISLQLPMEKVVQNVIKSGWSRVPIYSGSLDRIVGFIYSKDLLVAWRSQSLLMLEDLLRPILTVSPDMPLPELLRLFRTKHQHMAIIREKGRSNRLLGLVTLQDALEAIVGPIKEENQ